MIVFLPISLEKFDNYSVPSYHINTFLSVLIEIFDNDRVCFYKYK